jgi:hypothetical protein
MPRFFFNVQNGEFVPDVLGTEFATPLEARAAGVAMAGEMLRDAAREPTVGDRWIVTVTDEWGLALFTINVVVDGGGETVAS